MYINIEIIKKILEYFPILNSILDQFFIVGGLVRDLLIYQNNFELEKIIDLDIVVFDINIFELLNQKVNNFGTTTILLKDKQINISLLRKEEYDFKKNIIKNIILNNNNINLNKQDNLIIDSFRRDFTINAIYLDPINGIIFDPLNAISDINNKLLNLINPLAFWWDSSRIIRLLRYKKQCNLNFSLNTILLLKERLQKKLITNKYENKRIELEINRSSKIMNYNEIIEELTLFGYNNKILS
jgi:tRNA nucleotidyltransferase/poly(A) polymerase